MLVTILASDTFNKFKLKFDLLRLLEWVEKTVVTIVEKCEKGERAREIRKKRSFKCDYVVAKTYNIFTFRVQFFLICRSFKGKFHFGVHENLC